MNLKGKSVLITGASQGLGRALALELAREKAKIVAIARKSEPLTNLMAQIKSEGGSSFAILADVSNKFAIYAITAQAAQLAGPIDILINNASTLGPTPLRGLMDSDCEDLAQVFETNFFGPFRLSKALLGPMLIKDKGVILNISSDAATSPYENWGAYGSSKLAFDHLTRIWAVELHSTQIKILSVDPGEMDTQMHADAIPDANRALLARPSDIAHRLKNILLKIDEIASGSRLFANDERFA